MKEKSISIHLSLSLMVVTLVVGMLFGYYVSPSYQQTMYDTNEMGLGRADKFVDLRYLDQMATHHKAAMLLASQVEDKTDREEIKTLAKEILTNEPKLIDELYAWKKDWYKDSRAVKDPSVVNIGGKDDKTDLRFLNALIAHHQEGIAMTEEIKMKSSRKEVLDNADAVEMFLTTTLKTLLEWRSQWYEI